MVLDILPYEFIEILAHNEALVADAVDYAGHQDHVVFLFLAVLRIEDHFDDLLGNAEQFDALVHQALLQKGGELLNLSELPGLGLLQTLEELLGHRDLVEDLELRFWDLVHPI